MTDIGVNLASAQFRDEVDVLLAQARAAGVSRFVATGTSQQASREVLALAQRVPDVWATAGVHPHVAAQWSPQTAAALRDAAAHPRVVAIGECGLDYARMLSPRAAQLTAFREQLELARETAKPAFLHCRGAFDEFVEVVADCAGVTGVVHCFTGDERQAQVLLALGLDIGITGWICDARRSDELRGAVPCIPAQHLHLETDAPYLYPRNIPGAQRRDRNVPANLRWVAQALASLLGRDVHEVAATCSANSSRLFRLP